MATIAVLGTLDTKGEEHRFVADIIRQRGHHPLLIDVGLLSPPTVQPDVTREMVAATAAIDLRPIVERRDRGEAIAAMVKAAPLLVARLAAEGKIDAVISLGGSGGTAIGTAAMRALPVGFPKVMVSTMAGGNVAAYVGVKDVVMFPSIVDVSGINRISRQILARATGAICGMVEVRVPAGADKPLIVASMFGNTTKCVDAAKGLLEQKGYEVLVFHATGAGGRTMEALIASGVVTGVLDITTTEWADELVGGVLNAGPQRLEAAATNSVPAIVTPGCLDMVNFGPPETVPDKFKNRNFYPHNPQVTLMRTTPDECAQLGRILASKLNLSVGPLTVLLPLRAISVISAPGNKFHDPAADRALFDNLKANLRTDIPVQELDCEINDPVFAQACVTALLENIAVASTPAAAVAR
jgi:uncharacterized protein (UPF0261 family)